MSAIQLSTMSNNLPQQLTSFIGREPEIAEVHRLLLDARLLTLTGTGGTGKTRLALEVAGRLLDAYPDGVWLVELAAISEREAVPQAVASVLGVRETPERSLLANLLDHVRTRKLLLILDNCEHVVTPCAHLVHALLRNSTSVSILATSRQALGLDGECVWKVPPLTLPNEASTPDIGVAGEYEAVQLFVERARLRRSDFAITSDNLFSVIHLCRQLDALPLAIELAAARIRVLSVGEIAERLDERFQLLTSTSQVVEPRHRTLTALLDWSYELLNEAEQVLLRGLSVFAGGCTLEALFAVCGVHLKEWQMIELVSQLTDKSLLIVEEHDGQTRYRLLESVKQYAWGKVQLSGETVALRGRHLEYCLGLAEQTEDALLSEEQGVWLARLEREYGNLRSALDWSQVDGVDPDLGLRLSGALVWFWYFRGYFSEGRNELERAIENAQRIMVPVPPEVGPGYQDQGEEPFERTVPWATALTAAGTLGFLQGDYVAARDRLEQGLGIWRELGDRRGAGFALAFLGRVAMKTGDPACAEYGEESVLLFRQVSERWGLALSLDFLGEVAREAKDETRAATLHEESLALYRELKHQWGIALELSSLGRVATQKGDYKVAQSYLEEAVGIQRAVGDKWTLAWTLRNLAEVAQSASEYERARLLLDESLGIFQELNDREGIALTLGEISRLEEGNTRRPTHLEQPGDKAHPGSEEGLTPRQIEVLRLIADGLTDAQIGEQLCVSMRTVQAHIRSIYAKLDITSRSGATRYALEHGFV